MKKLLLLFLIAPVLGFGQYPNGLVIDDIFPVNLNNHTTLETALVVPENKVWYIISFRPSGDEAFKVVFDVDNFNLFPNSYLNVNPYWWREMEKPFYLLPQGTKIYEPNLKPDYYKRVILIYEFSFGNNSLSYNEPETIKNNSNTPVLFPNPTSSLLALNSDKEYDIEVYDMAGNKVMALTGNTIDMSHLSSATYIVKALDKVENEEVSYKVVKN